MFTLHFNCQHIDSREDFYQQLCQQYSTHQPFGESLDAFWDWLTGELPLPLTCHFHHLTAQQLSAASPLAGILDTLYQAQSEYPDLYHIVIDPISGQRV